MDYNAAVRTVLIRAAIVSAAVGILWLCAGRQISLLLDRVATVPYKTLAASPLTYEGGSFRIGELLLDDKPYYGSSRRSVPGRNWS